MSPPWLHRAKLRAGIVVCTYEALALAVDDPEVLPRITDWSHPRRHAVPLEDRARLVIALVCVTWVAVHLMRPWVLRWSRRGAR